MIFVIATVVCFAFLDVSRKIISKDFSSLNVTFLMVLVMGLGYSVNAVPEFMNQGVTGKGLVLGIMSGIFGMIANLSFVTALRYGPISILTPLLGFSAIVTVSLDYLVLRETLSSIQFLGLVSVVVGSALLIRAGWIEKVPTKSLVLGLVAASGWGIQTFLDPIGISEIGIHRWGAILAFSIAIPLIFFIKSFSFNLKLLIPGVFLFLASFAQLKSLEIVSSGVLESIKRGTILPLAIILGAVIFKEALSLRKAIAVFVLLVGGVIVSLA